MRSTTPNVDAEAESSGSDRTNCHARRLKDESGISAITTDECGERTDATRLFADDALNKDVTARANIQTLQRCNSRDAGDETALHVARAAPPQTTIPHCST